MLASNTELRTHLTEDFDFFLAKHNEEQRTLCMILWEFPRNCFQLPVANTGRPRMHDAFELEGVIQA